MANRRNRIRAGHSVRRVSRTVCTTCSATSEDVRPRRPRRAPSSVSARQRIAVGYIEFLFAVTGKNAQVIYEIQAHVTPQHIGSDVLDIVFGHVPGKPLVAIQQVVNPDADLAALVPEQLLADRSVDQQELFGKLIRHAPILGIAAVRLQREAGPCDPLHPAVPTPLKYSLLLAECVIL